MTEEQRAELAAIDAAIASGTHSRGSWARRAMIRAESGATVAELMADLEAMLRHQGLDNIARNLRLANRRLSDGRKPNVAPARARFFRALGAAYIWCALENLGTAPAWITRDLVAHICQMDDGEQIWELLCDCGDDDDESPAMWHSLAVIYTVLGGIKKGALLYVRALQLEREDGLWPDAETSGLARAQDVDLPTYQQLGWFGWLLDNAPYDVELRLQRARWFAAQHRHQSALDDFGCALVLRPNDPQIWEERAAHHLHADAPTDGVSPYLLASADYVEALRLRIQTGALSGYAHDLQTRGDALMKALAGPRLDPARAHAFYTLALETQPQAARLYLRRALALDASVNHATGDIHAAYPDYGRALALQPTLEKARAGAVRYLTLTLPRPTAHEQLEALLNARQTLLAAGVDAALAGAIVGEVEAALRAG